MLLLNVNHWHHSMVSVQGKSTAYIMLIYPVRSYSYVLNLCLIFCVCVFFVAVHVVQRIA